MPEEWDGYCAICASRDHCGDLRVHRLAPDADDGLESVRLCTPCFAFVVESLAGAVTRPESAPGGLHLPDRHTAGLPDGGCEVCHASLRVQPAFLLSLIPAVESPGPGPLLRFIGHPIEHRACGSCLDWFRDVIDQESACRWANRRRGDVTPGDTPAGARYRVASEGLDDRDAALVRDVVKDLGYVALPRPGGHGIFARDEVVYFVGAGEDGAATRFTEALPITERVRVIVVAGAAHIADATAALRAGAADLLATPLSRQQITGAFDRLADQFAVTGRDESTGLAVYWLKPRFGLPCFELEVRPPAGNDPLETFLVLRRFLRGYDRIGVTSGGTLPAIVYCGAEHIAGVVTRMHRLLGEGYRIAITGSALAGADDTSGDNEAPHRPAFASGVFFGKRLSRRAG